MVQTLVQAAGRAILADETVERRATADVTFGAAWERSAWAAGGAAGRVGVPLLLEEDEDEDFDDDEGVFEDDDEGDEGDDFEEEDEDFLDDDTDDDLDDDADGDDEDDEDDDDF
mgnify:CR=1 FL=1|jgi:hypothetical protein